MHKPGQRLVAKIVQFRCRRCGAMNEYRTPMVPAALVQELRAEREKAEQEVLDAALAAFNCEHGDPARSGLDRRLEMASAAYQRLLDRGAG